MGPDLILTFLAMPIGPSVNAAYATGKYGRRFKSKEMRDWEREMDIWAKSVKHKTSLKVAQEALKLTSKKTNLEITLNFLFEKGRILCKDGSSKRLDLDNRAKAILDNLSKKIGIDDCRFWKVILNKQIQRQGIPDECDARITVWGL